MDAYRAELADRLRAMEIATGEAAAACLPGLLSRLRHHETRISGNLLLGVYRRWRIRRLAHAVAEARWHIEQARLARGAGLAGRRT